MSNPESSELRPSRRTVLRAAAAAPLLGAVPRIGRPAESPNVLIFVASDLGVDARAHGACPGSTPNLDRLAAEGCLFENAYTPVAEGTASRSVLFTGIYPARNGAMGPERIQFHIRPWGKELEQAGLMTGLIGKLGVKSPRFSFDFTERMMRGSEKGRRASAYVEAFGRFLEERDERPFCLVVGLHDPGRPFPEFGETTPDPAEVSVPGFLIDTPEVRIELARYHHAIRRMDATVGAVLDELGTRGLAEDTLVLFTSATGMPFPFAKTTLYEAGIHIPLIARWPGVVQAGSRRAAFVGLMDVLPTLLDLAGKPVPTDLDGMSLVPLLRGGADSGHDAIFGSHTKHSKPPYAPSRSVRVGDLKYIHSFAPGVNFRTEELEADPIWLAMLARAEEDPLVAARVELLRHRPKEELYDLAADPYELENVLDDSRFESERRNLFSLLGDYMIRQSDPYARALRR